jgi:hypothetical protein
MTTSDPSMGQRRWSDLMVFRELRGEHVDRQFLQPFFILAEDFCGTVDGKVMANRCHRQAA